MTHEEAVNLILESILSQTTGDPMVDEAKSHIATCRQCWEALGAVYEVVFDQLPPELAEARRLLECEDIRPRLWEVADAEEELIKEIDPALGAHLERCSDCREELAALRQALAEEPAPAPVEPQRAEAWRSTGERLYELARAIVVTVWEGATGFLELPAGLIEESLAWAPEPVRATPRARRGKAPGRTSLLVELFDEGQFPRNTSLRVSLKQQSPQKRSFRGGTLSSQETRMEFPGLPPGEYLVELFLKPGDLTLKIPIRLTLPEHPLEEKKRAVQTAVTLPETPYKVRLRWISTADP